MCREIDELETPPEYLYLADVQEELSQNGFQIEDEDTELSDKLDELAMKLTIMNDHINKLSIESWNNGYADTQQAEYDATLVEYSQILKRTEGVQND